MNRALLSLAALLVVASSFPTANADAKTTFYLSGGDEDALGTHAMFQDQPGAYGTHELQAEEPAIWRADAPAEFNLDVAQGAVFNVTLLVYYSPAMRVEIGTVDNQTGAWELTCGDHELNQQNAVSNVGPLPGAVGTLLANSREFPIVTDKACPIAEGDYLGLRIVNGNGQALLGMEDIPESDLPNQTKKMASQVTWNVHEPPYPLPELPVVVLTGLGLVALVVLRRK